MTRGAFVNISSTGASEKVVDFLTLWLMTRLGEIFVLYFILFLTVAAVNDLEFIGSENDLEEMC